MVNLERELNRFVRQIRPGLIGATANPNVNLETVIEELKTSPHSRAQLTSALSQFILGRDFITALTETGLTLESGMFSEIYRRLEYKLLPKPVDDSNILNFLRRVLNSSVDVVWLEAIDRERFGEFLRLILPDHSEFVERLAPQVFMSLEILSLRLAGLGYEPLVTHRLKSRRDLQHAFMDVTRNVHVLLERGGETLPAVRESLARCAEAVRYVRSRRGVEGVSLSLTYRLGKIQEVIERLEQLLALIEVLLEESTDGWSDGPARDLFFSIVLAEMRRFDVGRFLMVNLELLAFQITEHTGRAGEHYITRTRAEWMVMLRSAALGGVIVALIAILKITASQLHLPPLPEALTYSLIYAGGFVFLHTMGATLATKQPAMTASTLAASLDESAASHSAMEALAEVVVRTVRSQLVAVLGNYLVAFPTAVAIGFALKYLHAPIMSAEKASHTLDSLHALRSLSFLYAAIAGVCLFLSGLLAGYADNWFVFNHVGSRLRRSDLLGRLVGDDNLDRATSHIDHNLGFWVGNICLGFFLGCMGSIGIITGLPLDIRHITFASAQFGAALVTLNFAVAGSTIAAIAVSVFVMGLINLAVSFSLTMIVVVKSRRIRFAQTPLLLAKLGKRLRQRPLEFVFPSKDAA